MKITFQNQTINETDNRTESNRAEKNSWGKDKTWRSKKSVNVNFGAVYESGQAAVSMPSLEKEENNKGKSLMELQQDIAFDKDESMIGRSLLAMIEGKVADENAYVARTYRDAPNVDGYLFINTSRELMTGDFVQARVTGAYEYDLIGGLEDEFTK